LKDAWVGFEGGENGKVQKKKRRKTWLTVKVNPPTVEDVKDAQ